LKKSLLIIFLILIVDQVLKLWIKTQMELRDTIEVFSWFQLYFTENPGMAFGLEYGGNYGKLALSIFRIFAIFALIYWLRSLIKNKAPNVALVAVSLITAGAIGNMIDSAFYGLIFDKGMQYSEEFNNWVGYGGLAVTSTEGYSLFEGFLPDWVPFKGGDHFIFFRPIFNIADTAISTGVGLLVFFQKKVFPAG